MTAERDMLPDDDTVPIIDDADDALGGETAAPPWVILIVDDDEEVHSSTVFALGREHILGRPLAFLHAHSAAQARPLIAERNDLAVILLDVVMEESDAGLRLVHEIRRAMLRDDVRIILRTGQPGYAPEADAIRNYDINDYRTKSELTSVRLLTSVTAAIRSYDQIRSISYQRRGLAKIVDASSALFEKKAIDSFSEGVILQLAALLHIEPHGILCISHDPTQASSADTEDDLRITGATGTYRERLGMSLARLGDARITTAVGRCLEGRTTIYGGDWTAIYVDGKQHGEAAVFVDTPQQLGEIDRQLLTVFCTNISIGLENVGLIDRLHGLAYRDVLTFLPNRNGLLALLGALRVCNADARTLALVDINAFAEINDALGHGIGDGLLRAVAQRLSDAFGKDVTVARVTSDTFAVVTAEVGGLYDRIAALFAQPFAVAEYQLPVSVTVGFAAFSEVEGGSEEVLKAASIALKHAKSKNRGRFLYYSRSMGQELRERLELTQRLQDVLKDGSLAVHYQPQVRLTDGKVVGAEALVRWRSEDGSYVPPDRFIAVAERAGLITDLGEFVLAEACRQAARWAASGLGDVRIAVNVSIGQFRSGDFLERSFAIIRECRVEPHQLEIEITESMVMNDPAVVIGTLTAFRRQGFSVSLDDFGTGFSSLAVLQQLPVDRLKVDRAFVRELGSRGRGEKIAEMVVQLAKTLDLSIIGEGIETEDQQRILREWGCHDGQGWLYLPAVPHGEFEAWARGRV
jgi:diguanylate cyclase (GGDEF)-like protein